MYIAHLLHALIKRWNSVLWHSLRYSAWGSCTTLKDFAERTAVRRRCQRHLARLWQTQCLVSKFAGINAAPFLCMGVREEHFYGQRPIDVGDLNVRITAAFRKMTRGKNGSPNINLSLSRKRSCGGINLRNRLNAFHITQRFTFLTHKKALCMFWNTSINPHVNQHISS